MLIVDSHAHNARDDDRLYPPMSEPFRPPAGTGTVAHLKRERNAAKVLFARRDGANPSTRKGTP
jgi:hypothetical protein